MSLLDPTFAEAIDRLTILHRKIVERRLANLSTGPHEAEAAALLYSINQDGYKLILELGALNAAIWDRENQIRLPLSDETTAKLSREIAALNELRAGWMGEAKVYANPPSQ